MAVASAGCLDGGDDGEGPASTREPSQVTTTAGGDVGITGSRVVFDGEGGPRVEYSLQNEGSADETVAVRTAMDVGGGDRYEETVYVDVPAGDEVDVEYLIVAHSELSDDEERAVRRGEAAFEVHVNGERQEAF